MRYKSRRRRRSPLRIAVFPSEGPFRPSGFNLAARGNVTLSFAPEETANEDPRENRERGFQDRNVMACPPFYNAWRSVLRGEI